MTLEFWLASIVVTATPGTGALFTIAAGLARGARAGLVAAVGCTLGIVPHLVLAVTGAATVLAASPAAFEAIKWLGVAYLIYLAWGTWRQTGVLALEADSLSSGGAPTVRQVIGNAVLVNLLNPKLTIFFFVFLPIFVDPTVAGAAVRMTGLSLVFMAITLVIFAGYGLVATIRDRPTERDGLGRARIFSDVRAAGSAARGHPEVTASQIKTMKGR